MRELRQRGERLAESASTCASTTASPLADSSSPAHTARSNLHDRAHSSSTRLLTPAPRSTRLLPPRQQEPWCVLLVIVASSSPAATAQLTALPAACVQSSIGTGYDLSTSTYSPDGRIFQVRLLPPPLSSLARQSATPAPAAAGSVALRPELTEPGRARNRSSTPTRPSRTLAR